MTITMTLTKVLTFWILPQKIGSSAEIVGAGGNSMFLLTGASVKLRARGR